MSSLYSGTDVRVARDGRVWVMVPAGADGASAHWRQVPLRDLRLDVALARELVSPFGRHPLEDLGIDARRLAHDLGLPIRDDETVRQMWDLNRHIRGSAIAIDFHARELTRNPDHHHDGLVWPLSAFDAVTEDARLRVRRPPRGPATFIDIGDFPLGLAPIARAISR